MRESAQHMRIHGKMMQWMNEGCVDFRCLLHQGGRFIETSFVRKHWPSPMKDEDNCLDKSFREGASHSAWHCVRS